MTSEQEPRNEPTPAQPKRRFQFTIIDLLVISLACVLWVAVFAPFGPEQPTFDDQFLEPSGRRLGNCAFFIVSTVLAGVAVLVWAYFASVSRSRQTAYLVVTLMLLLPLFFAAFFAMTKCHIDTNAQYMHFTMQRLAISQQTYRHDHSEYASSLAQLKEYLSDDQGIAQAEELPGQVNMKPFQGYVFRILKARGPHAPGGRQNYVTRGEDGRERMTKGYAIIAYPIRIGGTGITLMFAWDTEQVGPVYGKALGPEAWRQAREIVEFDPDESWIEVKR
jgi:hypothetical protein